jgi:hypothetical protein
MHNTQHTYALFLYSKDDAIIPVKVMAALDPEFRYFGNNLTSEWVSPERANGSQSAAKPPGGGRLLIPGNIVMDVPQIGLG